MFSNELYKSKIAIYFELLHLMNYAIQHYDNLDVDYSSFCFRAIKILNILVQSGNIKFILSKIKTELTTQLINNHNNNIKYSDIKFLLSIFPSNASYPFSYGLLPYFINNYISKYLNYKDIVKCRVINTEMCILLNKINFHQFKSIQ